MNLLFDLDGTLADPWEAFAGSLDHAYAALGLAIPPRDRVRALIGPPLHAQLPELLGPERATLAPEVLRIFREHHGREGIYRYRFYPGMLEALDQLGRAGHRLFVATSKPQVYAREIFRHLNQAALFDEIYGSELDGTRSKKGDLIAHILSTHALAPGETVMIGDRKHDAIGAQENGVRAVGVLWGYGDRAELEAAGASPLAENWPALVRAFS